MFAPVDIHAYCRRIGYSGRLEPHLETLEKLQRRHIAAIPFEAIDALRGAEIDIAPAAVDAKLLGSRRGGCCLEQNMLFGRVLHQIGFKVELMMGRVVRGSPPGDPQPRTHLVSCVTLDDQRWLADVAFGAYVPPKPLRIAYGMPQPTEFDTYRIVRRDNGIALEMLIGADWEWLYWLSSDPVFPADLIMANWYVSAHPASPFRRQLIAARTADRARYALLNDRLTTHWPNGSREQAKLSAAGVETALADLFGLPVEAGWRGLIERSVG